MIKRTSGPEGVRLIPVDFSNACDIADDPRVRQINVRLWVFSVASCDRCRLLVTGVSTQERLYGTKRNIFHKSVRFTLRPDQAGSCHLL